MRVEVRSATPLRFTDGSPVRAASGVVAHDGGWLVLQDDSTYACLWRDGVGTPLRLLGPVRGLDVFDEASGTKALKPDLEACVTLPDGRTLVLGSGSTPARMRAVLLSPASILVSGLAPVLRPGGRRPRTCRADQLNLEGACVVGESLRWFQRGLPAAGVPSASVDVPLDGLLDVLTGAPAAVSVSGVRRYDLGGGLAITDAVALPDGTVLVSATAEASASTYDDGPVTGSALARLDGEVVLDLVEVPRVDGAVVKVEGLALSGPGLVAVVDADDPAVPSLLLELDLDLDPLSSSRRRPGSSGCRGRCARSAAAGARAGTPSAPTRSGRRSRRRRRS